MTVKSTAFALAFVAAALVLVPSGDEIMSAVRRSGARPELESWLRERAGDAESPELLHELIRIRRRQGDRAGERALRARLAERDPEDAANLEELMTAYLWENRTAEAYALADVLCRRFPDRRELRERLVELAEYTGRPAEARPHALWLLERGARSPRMLRVFIASRDIRGLRAVIASPLERARALVAAGAQIEAIAAYREHLDSDPRDAAARRELARLYLWNARPLEAAAELEALVALTGEAGIRDELVALYRAAHRIDLMLPHLPENLERAEILLALGRTDEARAAFEKLGRIDRLLELALGMSREDDELAVRERMPLLPENRKRLADLYAWKKDFAKALAHYEVLDEERTVDMYLALGDLPGAIRVAKRLGLHARLGDLYLWSGDLAAAIGEYEQVPGEKRELARLYIMVGRREEAVRLLDTLSEDIYVMAELYLYAGRGDRVRRILEGVPIGELDAWLVERLARAADAETAEALYAILLRRDPGNETYLRALVDLYEWRGRPDLAADTLRVLLQKFPNDAELWGRLGFLTRDREALERAASLGSKDPRILRWLGDLAYSEKRPADAIRHYRAYHRLKDDDYESHFILGELTGDASEIDRAWSLLPPDERRVRLRILIWRKDLAAALALIRTTDDPSAREALVDLLIAAGWEKEAISLGLTPRQQAVLAIRHGRYEEAVAILQRLDVNDPDIRQALAESLVHLGRWREAEELVPGVSIRHRAALALERGDHAEAVALLRKLDLSDPELRDALARSLLALGRWQEAEEYAQGELREEIRGTYGPEGSASYRMRADDLEKHVTVSGRYRMQLTQKIYARLDLAGEDFSGTVAGMSETQSARLSRAAATVHAGLLPRLELGAGGGGWAEAEKGGQAYGLAEAELDLGIATIEALGELDAPWTDSLEAALVAGTRDRAQAQAILKPILGVTLSGGVEQLRYESHEDLGLGLEGEVVSETRVRGRADVRLWTGKGNAGRHFFDLPLLEDYVLETHVGFAVQADLTQTYGSDALMAFAQLVERTSAYTAGPVAGLAGSGWGVLANAFVGLDPERELDFGELWGGSAAALVTLARRMKLSSTFEYVNEQRRAVGGSAWTVTVGLNFNF
jgi:tetratricopeptide (TPR) repeat protein